MQGSGDRPTAGESKASTLAEIRYRPIGPGDWHKLQRFHARLSPETIERRFHAAKRELSTPLAHRLTDVDGSSHFGIVATRGTKGRIVGVARYISLNPTTAEVAFVIEDAYQHRGVGHELMRLLRAAALQHGIIQFIAEVLPGNIAMLRLLKQAGETQVHTGFGEWEVRVRLSE